MTGHTLAAVYVPRRHKQRTGCFFPGKKCTYGHKCKYYHPERGTQPQRAVADELRASAKTCTAAKNQGDAGLVKSHSVPAGSMEAKKGAPKRQSDPSIRALSCSDAEEKLLSKGRADIQKSGSVAVCPAPEGAPPSALGFPQDQQSRAGTPHGLPASGHDLYPHCESPDLNYYSVTRAYSGLSLSARRSPDCRFPNDGDLRLGSMGSTGSECGSESSVSCSSSCDSYGERPCPGCPSDPLLEDGVHFVHPHSRPYPGGVNPELCGLHPADYPNVQHSHPSHPGIHGYHLGAGNGQSYAHDQPPPEVAQKRPLYPLPLHLQHQPLSARSSCPGDYHSLPQSAPHPPGSPLGRCLGPLRPGSASDSHLYEHLSTSHHHHRSKPPPSWDSYYRHAPFPPPRYELSAYHSLPDSYQPSWRGSAWTPEGYGQHHPPHTGLHSSPTHYVNHPAPPAHPSHPSSSSHQPYPHHLLVPSSHAPPLAYVQQQQHPESPTRSCYSDAREKVYVNLCNIFPAELVSRVMARSPHVTDPQQLAAAILAEKAQGGY